MPKTTLKSKSKTRTLKLVPKPKAKATIKAKKAAPKKAKPKMKAKPTEVLPPTTNNVVLKLWQAKKNEKPETFKHHEPESWKGKTPMGPNAWDGHTSKFSGPRRRAS